ncbi:3'(2'),5'-bisphosphate nucleotidase CysQ [Salinicola sp. DM10]|uniref:3'(2'),5'-bisphosphate nucleotidase CysQ n=1 Tax=Salinicola sp. DM10 TaxID=2815721 RepID=UPI001A8C2A2A|nr:3'(2'),5'-bisphosphate nucleotidase CysQ [Salinicola sp. DM10]MCE3025582.1 3'(2'),5'-bisphosphate nucleotidase CysQ [Salinicola sp. DM10]
MSASLYPSFDALASLCRRAGEAILSVAAGGLETRFKSDASPVTDADLAAHQVLMAALPTLGDARLPVLSEEAAATPWETRRRWSRYWLIDPLDGTKEFIRGSDEYSVNVALIRDQRPVLGVIAKPGSGEVWAGGAESGAWYQPAAGAAWIRLGVESCTPPRVMVSRHHCDAHTRAFIARLPGARVEALGSSLKCCRIAAGEADLYPRFGPTSEWDTAAAQAILEGAGGALVDPRDWQPLRYNTKASLLNPDFVACADPQGDWRAAWQAAR